MTHEEHWDVDPTTRVLLRQIVGLGYRVSVFYLPPSLWGTVPACVEMHAVDARQDPADKHVAKVIIGEGDEAYRCACALAKSIGIRLRE